MTFIDVHVQNVDCSLHLLIEIYVNMKSGELVVRYHMYELCIL